MSHNRDKLAPQTHRQQSSKQKEQETRPRGVHKEQRPLRRRARLSPRSGEDVEQQLSPTAKKTLQQRDRSTAPQPRHKRLRETEDPPANVTPASFSKRRRTSPQDVAATPAIEASPDPIDYWRREQAWPKEYFEPEDTMNHLLARTKSTPSLRRKRSEGSLVARSTTPSDQKPRDEKSAPYRDARYETLLETKGIFMIENREGPKKESKDMCRKLLADDQDVPQVSRFSDDIFKSTCQRIQNRNEAKIIQDITRLIVPSAEELTDFGAEHLEYLVEAVNEGWNNSIPLTGTRPQPDYSVGFKRNAFSDDQHKKLSPFIGEFLSGDLSFFMATYYMYFPFLTCEVKCSAAALDIADRQNAHSITLAVRAVVELFRLVKREEEIHRDILAFSVSHDHRSVRIYGHYAVIDGAGTSFYRHPIHTFDFTALDGKDRWTAYKFTKSVYNSWMPTHFRRICSAVDDLPSELDFEVPPLQPGSGFSGIASHHLSRSFVRSTSQLEDRSESGIEDERDITPNTSFTAQGASKKPRGMRQERTLS
ncbi:hypothetical protein P154DRAFT_537919 [Amniculicola lignicola CBS 123094]|uniref:DUF7924 domain-containing protein n=1 Tax=Amniculicola lignicola CBS 123094 TaxID=1392246 RepID=A0A6A5WFZ5_9PLEO|nr:hypothetical protein P154DRAFT_537919 [Amniculicola lignicola CBS 123094]